MSELEKRAYRIGEEEAKENRRNIPAAYSRKMCEFMSEVKNGLLPLIKAYNRGMMNEMSKQAWEVLNSTES